MAMKYIIFTLCLFLSACSPSKYPDLHSVPDHLDISKQKSSCAAQQQELEAVACS